MSILQASQDKANVNLTSSQAILNLSLAAKNFHNANDQKAQKACSDLAIKLMHSEGGLPQEKPKADPKVNGAEPASQKAEPEVRVEVEMRTGLVVDLAAAIKMGLGHLSRSQLKDYVSKQTGVPVENIELI